MLHFSVHQCLFCQQTFDSAAHKDNHVLEHFVRETCTECDEDLIRIGGYLYVRHNEATCIKRVEISQVFVESCTAIETVLVKPELENDEYSVTTGLVTSDMCEIGTQEIKIEPVNACEQEVVLLDINGVESGEFCSY